MDTSHSLSSISVDRDGDDNATVTAVTLNMHCPAGRGREPDGPKFLISGQYKAHMVRTGDADGEWKIKDVENRIYWKQGDPSVMPKPPGGKAPGAA